MSKRDIHCESDPYISNCLSCQTFSSVKGISRFQKLSMVSFNQVIVWIVVTNVFFSNKLLFDLNLTNACTNIYICLETLEYSNIHEYVII